MTGMKRQRNDESAKLGKIGKRVKQVAESDEDVGVNEHTQWNSA